MADGFRHRALLLAADLNGTALSSIYLSIATIPQPIMCRPVSIAVQNRPELSESVRLCPGYYGGGVRPEPGSNGGPGGTGVLVMNAGRSQGGLVGAGARGGGCNHGLRAQ